MKPRVLYAAPSGGHPWPEWVASVAAIRMTTKDATHLPEDWLVSKAPVHMARSHILLHSVEHNFDYVVMHDDDLEIGYGKPGNPIDEALKLMAQDSSVGIVGLVYLRQHPVAPLVVMRHPDYPDVVEHCQVVAGLPSEPFPVQAMGFGWVMIRVAAIRDLMERESKQGISVHEIVRWGHRQDVAGNFIGIGEDYYFCDRLIDAGWKVLADPRFGTIHHKASQGGLTYEHEAWERYCASEKFPRMWQFEHAPRFASGPDTVPSPLYFKDADGELKPLPESGTMLYRQDHAIEVPEGGRVIVINGMSCIDMSQTRFIHAQRSQANQAAKAAEVGG